MPRRLPSLVVAAVLGAAAWGGSSFAGEDDAEARAARLRLVRWIGLYAAATSAETGVEAIDPRVLAAMAVVPRHEFVPEPLKPMAYLDTALPVGHGQSVSQPFLIALMTHLARIRDGDVVFETGTDTGYQAAVLSRLAGRVYSVEYAAPLAAEAALTLTRLGFKNIEVRAGDGYYGWAEMGPFDAILVKEAVRHVPPPLLKQLKAGGRLIAPVGPLDGVQTLTLIEKDENGRLTETRLIPVRFRPLQGGERI